MKEEHTYKAPYDWVLTTCLRAYADAKEAWRNGLEEKPKARLLVRKICIGSGWEIEEGEADRKWYLDIMHEFRIRRNCRSSLPEVVREVPEPVKPVRKTMEGKQYLLELEPA